jgi:molybdopterin molybdotransferase
VLAGHAPDRASETAQLLERALAGADVVVAAGGVSVGPHDHVKQALRELGVQERFWRVALKPGKPTWFGTQRETLVFGLPGNPVSAMVTFLLFTRPALAVMEGAPPNLPRRLAIAATAIPRDPRRDQAVRVRLEQHGTALRATPTGPQGSHILTSMLGAGGLALVAAGEGEVAAGDRLTVELI